MNEKMLAICGICIFALQKQQFLTQSREKSFIWRKLEYSPSQSTCRTFHCWLTVARVQHAGPSPAKSEGGFVWRDGRGGQWFYVSFISPPSVGGGGDGLANFAAIFGSLGYLVMIVRSGFHVNSLKSVSTKLVVTFCKNYSVSDLKPVSGHG